MATRPPQLWQAHVALIAAQFCFGLFPVFGKKAFMSGAFTPRSIAVWRILAGALVLGALAVATYGRRVLPPRGLWPRLFSCALLGVVLNQGLYLHGLERSTATESGLVMCLIPVFTFCLACVSGQEQFRWLRAGGVVLALAGVIWLSDPRASENTLGNALMAANGLSFSAYLVLSRPLVRKLPPLVVIAWVYVLATPAAVLFARGEVIIPHGAPLSAWGSLAFILICATVLGYLLNVFALSRVRASTTAVYLYSQPLLTGAAGIWLLGEEPRAGTFGAALLILLGITLVSRRPPSVVRD